MNESLIFWSSFAFKGTALGRFSQCFFFKFFCRQTIVADIFTQPSSPPPPSHDKKASYGPVDTFYDDRIEYKHYINDILKNFPVNEDVLNEQQETSKCETSCIEQIKSLENKIDILQTENKRLVEESNNYMKIIELLSVRNQNKTTEKNNINKKS